MRKDKPNTNQDIKAVGFGVLPPKSETKLCLLPIQPDLITIDVKRFCEVTCLGKTSAWRLIRDGSLETRRRSGRTLILWRSVLKYFDVPPEEQP